MRIPLLNVFGMPLLSAFAVNIFVIPFAQSVGAYTHRKNIDKNIALHAVLGGVLGSISGAIFTGLVRNRCRKCVLFEGVVGGVGLLP